MVGLSPEAFPISELFWGGPHASSRTLTADQPLVLVIDDIQFAEADAPRLPGPPHRFGPGADPGRSPRRGGSCWSACPTGRSANARRGSSWNRCRQPTRSSSSTGCSARPGLSTGVRERVVSAAEGNPFFVEQMVSMLIERGFIRHEGDSWVPTTDLSELTIPPSINALLAARLDDLSREERAVIEPAAVIGLTFPEPAVSELVPDPIRPVVARPAGTASAASNSSDRPSRTKSSTASRTSSSATRPTTACSSGRV